MTPSLEKSSKQDRMLSSEKKEDWSLLVNNQLQWIACMLHWSIVVPV